MSVGVLIATYERSHLLRNNLARMYDLTHPDEIVVVDDGGSDGCEEVCREAPLPVTYIYTHNPGPALCSHARNVGLNAMRSDLVIQTEPEMLFETDVVAQLVAAHRDHPDVFTSAGTIRHLNPDGTLKDELVGWAATYAVLYERDKLLEIGGWDDTFPDPWGWDDVDLLSRYRIRFLQNQRIDPDIVASHQWHPQTFAGGDQSVNAAHFMAKGFHEGQGGSQAPTDPGVVIRRGLGWGEPKCR